MADILESLVWIAVILFWLFTQVLKGRSKKGKPAPVADQRSDERKTPAKQTMGALKSGLREFFNEIAKMQEDKRESSSRRRETVQKPLPPPLPPRPDRDASKQKPPVEPYGEKKRVPELSIRQALSGQSLRQAVLLREILGPPVALKDDDRRFE